MTRLAAVTALILCGFVMALQVHGAGTQDAVSGSRTGARLITLGTAAGPSLRPDRTQSSNVLTVNGVHYLVDAGDGVARRLEQAGIDIRDIGIIFLTHHHDDHTAGLGTLISVAWDRQRTNPINIFGPPRTAELATAAAQSFRINSEIRLQEGRTAALRDIVVGHDVGVGLIFEDANVKVIAAENSHFDFHNEEPSRRPKSFSYRFETRQKVIVFTGDTGPSTALTSLAEGADLLVAGVESFEDRMQGMIKDGRWQAMTPEEQAATKRQASEGHMNPEQVGELAVRAKVKTVILSHLGPKIGSDYTAWADQIKKSFSGRVLVASDLEEF